MKDSFMLSIIRKICKPELLEEIEGNLLEYNDINKGKKWHFFHYFRESISYVRPSTLKSLSAWVGYRFHFNPRITVRTLVLHKNVTAISLLSLIIGFFCATYLYLYISQERAVDGFHDKSEVLYRTIRQSTMNGTPYDIGITSGPYRNALLTDFPASIVASCRVMAGQNALVSYQNNIFRDEEMLFADDNFFELFSYPLSFGDPKSVLLPKNAVVISHEAAKKLFGDLNPIGQIIYLEHEDPYQVTGILAEPPAISHLQFDMVFNIHAYDQLTWFNDWWSNSIHTYVQLASADEVGRINEALPAFMDKYFGEDFARTGNRINLKLQPLSNIYFDNHVRYDMGVQHGDQSALKILTFIGLAVLFIACFNYVNLSIGQCLKRTKEVSVRKAIGSEWYRLVVSFVSESLLLVSSAALIGMVLLSLTIPVINELFGVVIVANLWSVEMLQIIVVSVLVITLLSATYPSLMIMSFPIVAMLKGGKLSIVKGKRVRQTLVLFQFTASIFLIICTGFIAVQLNYMLTKDLGFDKDSIVMIDVTNDEIQENRSVFIDALKSYQSVKSVTSMTGEPGGFHDATTVLYGDNPTEKIRMRIVSVDENYLKTFDLKMHQGEGFVKPIPDDVRNYAMINQKGLTEWGLTAEEVIGRTVKLPSWNDLEVIITGVVKDYHFQSLKQSVEPLIILQRDNQLPRMAIKISGVNMTGFIEAIETQWSNVSPNFPMDYKFLDEKLIQQYQTDIRQQKIFIVLAAITVLLAIIGVLGLARYEANNRIKELGIRKILGSSSIGILKVLTRQFVLLIGMAGLLSLPMAWYFVNAWLSNYAYSIDMSGYWFIFPGGLLITIVIAGLIIGINGYRVATENPTNNLRYE
ncbi:MAG: ABC transporter permease [Cyclobacteriaceae bacterium]